MWWTGVLWLSAGPAQCLMRISGSRTWMEIMIVNSFYNIKQTKALCPCEVWLASTYLQYVAGLIPITYKHKYHRRCLNGGCLHLLWPRLSGLCHYKCKLGPALSISLRNDTSLAGTRAPRASHSILWHGLLRLPARAWNQRKLAEHLLYMNS